MSRTATTTGRASDRRLILDPSSLQVRCGCRCATLDKQEAELLRLAWDNRGHSFAASYVVASGRRRNAGSATVLGQLSSKLGRALGVCPIHEQDGDWVWDGADRLVELSSRTL